MSQFQIIKGVQDCGKVLPAPASVTLKKVFYPRISRIDANYEGGKQEGSPK
jgi:hypothetical protein